MGKSENTAEVENADGSKTTIRNLAISTRKKTIQSTRNLFAFLGKAYQLGDMDRLIEDTLTSRDKQKTLEDKLIEFSEVEPVKSHHSQAICIKGILARARYFRGSIHSDHRIDFDSKHSVRHD